MVASWIFHIFKISIKYLKHFNIEDNSKVLYKIFGFTILVGILWSCVLCLQRPPPRYSQQYMPETSFTCRNKIVGSYYADPETDCQVFHVCVSVAGSIQDYKWVSTALKKSAYWLGTNKFFSTFLPKHKHSYERKRKDIIRCAFIFRLDSYVPTIPPSIRRVKRARTGTTWIARPRPSTTPATTLTCTESVPAWSPCPTIICAAMLNRRIIYSAVRPAMRFDRPRTR